MPSRPGKSKVAVLNFGVSGFSTARELILLQKRVWQYSPDVIVLLVTTSNDVKDNSRTLNQYSGQPLPYFVYRDGKLILDDSLLAARKSLSWFSSPNILHWQGIQLGTKSLAPAWVNLHAPRGVSVIIPGVRTTKTTSQ